MDFSGGGLSLIQQSGLSDRAAFSKTTANSFANCADEKTLQQQQHQQQQRTQFLFHQQQQRLQQPIESRTNASQSAFVSLSALNSASIASPLVVDRHASTSTQSSSGWHDSPTSNAADSLSSPTSSIVSALGTNNFPSAPLIDPLLLDPAKQTNTLKTADVAEAPKRSRGRPRLSEGAPRTARAATSTATKPQKKRTSRRTSTASASGADDYTKEHGGTINDKKTRIRARNREAAYKCRKKKQKGIEELQTQEAIAENINKSLNNEAAQLRGEILMLKNMVLQHGGCGCSYIEEYIAGAAQNLVQSSMAAAGSVHGGGIQMHDQNCANGAGAGGEGYIDWKTFDMDTKVGLSSLESESGFSGYDNSASHSVRAQSQGATMV